MFVGTGTDDISLAGWMIVVYSIYWSKMSSYFLGIDCFGKEWSKEGYLIILLFNTGLFIIYCCWVTRGDVGGLILLLFIEVLLLEFDNILVDDYFFIGLLPRPTLASFYKLNNLLCTFDFTFNIFTYIDPATCGTLAIRLLISIHPILCII